MVAVLPFDDEADAIALANDTPYGLSGSIWTRDCRRALRVSRAVESGNLSVNSHSSVRYCTPFGGFKQSGLGRELGPDAPLTLHRDQERLLSRSEEPDGDLTQRLARQGRASSPAAPAASAWPTGRRSRPRARTSSSATSTRPAGKAAADELGGLFVHVDVTDEAAVDDLFDTARDDLRLGRHRLQQRRHLAARRRLDRDHRARRPGSGCRTSTSSRCTCAARRRCGTCVPQGRARSSTPRRSWR